MELKMPIKIIGNRIKISSTIIVQAFNSTEFLIVELYG